MFLFTTSLKGSKIAQCHYKFVLPYLTPNSLLNYNEEYGVQVYHVASSSNFDKLERVQLSAARAIKGLRNGCTRDIVLYEADLQPLRHRSKTLLAKYFAKLTSYSNQHRTSIYLCNWSNNRQLKTESPLSRAESEGWLQRDVEYVTLPCCSAVSASLFCSFCISFRTNLDGSEIKVHNTQSILDSLL